MNVLLTLTILLIALLITAKAHGANVEDDLMKAIMGKLGYFWFVILALWGGTASYISRVKKTNSPFSLVELIGEWTISGFAGIVTALICEYLNMDFTITAALAGISGHMGGRSIYLAEQWLVKRAQSQVK